MLSTTLSEGRVSAPTIFQFLSDYGRKPGVRARKRLCGETSRHRGMKGLATALQIAVLRKREVGGLTEGTSPTLSLFRVVNAPSFSVGIDLEKRGVEVRKLFYAAFARGLVKDGYDPEEALQEVYKGLLARNRGTCPFDSRKSSFGHYVHIVARCVLANYVRKERRRFQFEVAMGVGEDGVSRVEETPDRKDRSISASSVEALAASIPGGGPKREALSLLIAGHSRREVVEGLGVEAKWLEKVLVAARETLSV